ncbi:iron-containing alcohol dehydrogenase [Marivivens donghaensis]|uniref:iron-containing alcohol dehydrogenase n=1 Tax=Marivivens donghaensis TaxID=1699413 RepID=UPI003D7C301A
MPAFAFATANEIVFGRGKARQSPPRIASLGRSVFVVTGQNAARNEWLFDALRAEGCEVRTFSVAKEPDVETILAGVAAAKGCDVVVAIGGGAVIDAGKAIAAIVPASRDLMDHLEVVGKGLPLDNPPLPFVAMPTTSGTGAEVTKNAVIDVPEHKRKVSLRDNRMLADLAIIDPALTDNCPKAITLASGLDAITQVIEPYICTRANPMTDALCSDAIPRGLKAIQTLMEREDTAARDDMALVSLFGGLALANAGLGVVHGLAGPLGGLTGAPHGAICGALLPHGLATNLSADPDNQRIAEVIRWIADAFGTTEQNALGALTDWSRANGLKGLDDMGISQGAREAAAKATETSSSMKANPVRLTYEQLIALMENAR